MKFLLELLSCCGPPSRSSIPSTASPPPAEETWSLFLSPPSKTEEIRRHRRRKRGRAGVLRSGSVSEWRPSLSVISENNIVPAAADGRPSIGSERIIKRKVTPTSRVQVQSQRDDCRLAHLPTIIPAFSPTPFLF